jgi:hypothetical protein
LDLILIFRLSYKTFWAADFRGLTCIKGVSLSPLLGEVYLRG